MTKSMADERQSQLEQYLQNVTLDSNITNSDVFIAFFRKLQQDTFKIQTQRAFLDVYLADGSNIKLDIQTSDTAEQILEVTLCKMGLSRELTKYFSLFFFQDHDDGVLSVVKKVAEFELPYVSLQSMKVLHCKLGIRKWYMDPSLDTLLMDCRASLNLLYMQAIQEVERNWVKPTEGQMQELELLQKNAHKVKVSLAFTANHSSSIFLLQFLELIREMQFYGYVRLDPCMCDYPEEGCTADVYVGNNEINCCIKLPTNQIKEVSFKINRLRSWQVTFLGATKGGEEDTLEFRFEYNDSGTWQWIILYTKQAFLLSSCLKKMISEHMTKAAREGQEMVVHSGFISRKRFLVRPNEDDRVFEKIREEDL
ncbi:sorting nexin-31 isoform X5 [Falco naumanni]|nr:sorting nexin-31 isoform X5 [Falco naumanni]XP_040442744.1 sorting nexin-31 isoform X5 [Falco naumanni]XP_040442745.1 sorting nexin-31 isoform X5 [Falco naumanni]